MKNILKNAEQFNLEVVDTTSESNGYPSNTGQALIGFEKFEEAEKLAKLTDGEIIKLFKKDGWGFWVRRGTAYTPYENSSEDYGDDYAEVPKMTEDEFIESEVKFFFEDDRESFEEIQSFLDMKKEIWDEVDAMEDGEVVITYQGGFSETIQKTSMSFYHDTKHYAIGVI